MDLGLKRRRAVVTGASRGIGRAIASALAAEGADVIAAARNAQKLQELAGAVQAGTGTLTPHVADMSKEADIQGLAGELGKADILVFNTGGPPFGTAAEITDAAWIGQFEAMFLSAIRLTRLALPGMRARKYGRIMLVVSSGVIQPIPNLALSNALRSGLVGWAKTLASEVAIDGVTVNCLAPGRISTDRIVEFDQARAKREGTTEDQARKASLVTIPAGRYGEADEFAAMAAFLASPKASYMTGGIIRIDGGMIRSV
jgi:3-oxoacyl-[acyl-carrier protein] reductase